MITVFGASVTQQRNGFAHRLEKSLGHPVKVIGYGGMHLDNAAICFIDEVIAARPDYCFVDWFSTGYNKENEKTIQCIDTIIYKLSRIKCKPIFLFFPFKNILGKEGFYKFCKGILDERQAAYIDIYSMAKDENIDEILKDSIHTTDYGSNLYCEIISKSFIQNNDCKLDPVVINKTEFVNINKIEVNKTFINNIKLYGDCEIVGFLLTIGPHSGLVEVSKRNCYYVENTWDRWCCYNRKHFNLQMRLSGNVELTILPDSFDTSLCKEDFDFSAHCKTLIVHSIYFVGKNLNVVNINEGKRIKIESIFIQNLTGKVRRYKKMLTKAFVRQEDI